MHEVGDATIGLHVCRHAEAKGAEAGVVFEGKGYGMGTAGALAMPFTKL